MTLHTYQLCILCMNNNKPRLIIEDDKIQQEYMRSFLERQGLQADVAGSLQEDIEVLLLP